MGRRNSFLRASAGVMLGAFALSSAGAAEPKPAEPPVAQPGQCFARVTIPEQTVERTLPAVTRQVVRQELVTPAKVEQRLSEPVYRKEAQRRVVREETEETVVIPEVRRTEQLRRVIAPSRT